MDGTYNGYHMGSLLFGDCRACGARQLQQEQLFLKSDLSLQPPVTNCLRSWRKCPSWIATNDECKDSVGMDQEQGCDDGLCGRRLVDIYLHS